jgi:hypothetical protein
VAAADKAAADKAAADKAAADKAAADKAAADKAAADKARALAADAELLTVSATSPGVWGTELSIKVTAGTVDPTNEFKLTVLLPDEVALESFDNLSWNAEDDNFVDRVINRASLYITVSAKVPQDKPEDLPKDKDLPEGPHPLTGDKEDKAVDDKAIGDGLHFFDHVTDVNILATPGRTAAEVVGPGVTYCENRGDCFFVADAPLDKKVDTVRDHVNNAAIVKSSYGALYFPWIKALDPTGRSGNVVLLPPSGFVTGIFARTDGKRGVFKAPAGTEATLAGALGLEVGVNDSQQDILNPIGVNVIRSFPASGIVVWGTRTLATRSKPEYRYVPVRRLTIFIEQSIYNGIQWSVFEPNDEPLWSSLRLSIGAFMMNQFRSGAFQGATASQAFFVKCDADTNPQSQIDAGVVTVLVGFAPVKPAEFVVLQISQKTAGAAV